ncbi:MAG: response regulator [Campylobacterota bacterium]|nr:response regulator [Campylobacterota bacterium]
MNDLSILVVEDEIELQNQLVEYFELYFKKIYTASNGIEAYESYNINKPSVIFTDINMPKQNGLDFILKIRENDDKTPVVILTAHTDTSYLLSAVELNLVSYLLKPIKMDKLRETIEKILKNIKDNDILNLYDMYTWDKSLKLLFFNNEKVNLSKYELLFLEQLIQKKNITVSYEELHYFIYDDTEFSTDAIRSLVKRLRQKTSKDLIKSSYKEGYKIEIL